jgi:hypothetical protein
MDNETDIIEKYIKSLAPSMRSYLIKNTWPQKLSLTSQTNKLTDEQSSSLRTEVLLILVGIENVSDLKINIQKNVAGINSANLGNIVGDIEKNIFSEIKPLLEEMETKNNEAGEGELSKNNVLAGIESPIPTKPIITNPAGKNPILDAQHNLPEQEKKILISSAAVPSRGPMLGNFKTASIVQPTKPQPVAPMTTPKPISPPIPTQTQSISLPTQQPAQTVQPVQPPKPPQTPVPPSPSKYSVDPYREPTD